MAPSWLLSALLHAALAVLLWFGLPGWGRPLPAIESGITVELVSEAELAPPEPEVAAVAPEPERQAARPKPIPPAPRPEPVAEPEPAPPPEPEPVAPPPEPEPVVEPEPAPPPVPEPEPVRAPPEPEPEPEPEPVVAEPEPEPQPEPEPAPELARAEPEPAPPAEPEPAPPPQAALEPEPPPTAAPPRPEPPAALPKPQTKPAPPPAPQPKQARAKPEPAPPQAKAPEPPKQDEFDALLASVEKMDRRAQGDVRQEGTGRDPEAAGRARTSVGDVRLSSSEINALIRQIGGCWTLPAGIDGIDDMVVRLRIQVRPDRTVQGVAIEDQGRLGRDPKFRAVAESARRAVEGCSPLNLPPDKYALWRDIVMNFHPEDAING